MLQLAGLWMALATFLGIWLGHVSVRWVEAHSRHIWIPITAYAAGGVILNIFSPFAPNLIVAGVSSILGITLLWDAFEVYRQEKRVRKGHAPANPNNPRHAAILAAGYGTTEDLLEREPQGVPAVQQTGSVAQSRVAASTTRAYGKHYEEVEV
jgi:hypothetical protein